MLSPEAQNLVDLEYVLLWLPVESGDHGDAVESTIGLGLYTQETAESRELMRDQVHLESSKRLLPFSG